MDSNEAYTTLKEILVSEFELEAGAIAPEKRLDNDLDLDSLDIADLIITLEDRFNKKIEPTQFRDARTVQDLVDRLVGSG